MRIGVLLVLAISIACSGCNHDDGEGGDGGYLTAPRFGPPPQIGQSDGTQPEQLDDCGPAIHDET